MTAFIDQHWQDAGKAQQERFEPCVELVDRIFTLGSKGKSGKIRHGEAQQLLVDTFELVSELDALTGLEPLVGETASA